MIYLEKKMKILKISDELYEVILSYSKQETCPEQSDDEFFNAMDWSGGNFDDAYSDGVVDGHIELSRRIIDEA
jgi:hypothetical protein